MADKVDEMRPGDRLVITPMAVRNGVYMGKVNGRTRSIYGELVRVVRSYREPGVRRLLVRRDGNKVADTYATIFWRKLLPGETVDVAALIEEGERMRERDGLGRLHPPPPAPEPTQVAEVSPDTTVWALAPDGGRHIGIKRRMCKLREVPTGWEWEPCDE